MLEIKREEKHLLGLKAVSAFLQTSKMFWIQVCGMISHARESEVTFGLNLHQLLRDLWKHSGKYANVAFPIQYKECYHGSQGMKFPSEHYHSLERCCSVAYGWRWVIFLVSSILTIKHIMRKRERGIEFSLCYQSFNTWEQNRWVNLNMWFSFLPVSEKWLFLETDISSDIHKIRAFLSYFMIESKCNPLGLSGRLSQILQGTFRLWTESEMSTTQTY